MVPNNLNIIVSYGFKNYSRVLTLLNEQYSSALFGLAVVNNFIPYTIND